MSTEQDYVAKLAKLIERAESRGTTEEEAAEADLAMERALKFSANHGISLSQARAARPEVNVIEEVCIEIGGKYPQQQADLATHIAGALHCEAVLNNRNGRPVAVRVFGANLHTQRTRVLFAILLPLMMRTAARVTPERDEGISAKRARISYMQGFAYAIYDRLTAAETEAASESDQATGTTTQALALQTDAERAKAAVAVKYPKLTRRKYKPAVDPSHMLRGYDDGHKPDLGTQSGIGDARKAIQA